MDLVPTSGEGATIKTALYNWLYKARWSPLLRLVLAVSAPAFSNYDSQAIDHYVSPSGANLAPFTDWSTAATNIQTAVDVATDGDVIWVTNGVYNTGGKALSGTLTNRVALDKSIRLQSVNGPAVTTIVGQPFVPPPIVRCAWLTNGSVLSGFTLRQGGTLNSGDQTTLQSGGGVWCAGPSALVTNCIIGSCVAFAGGGGANGGILKNCLLRANYFNGALGAGGAYGSILINCGLIGNWSNGSGVGGTRNCALTNCSLIDNFSISSGTGGSYSDTLANCIVYFNSNSSGFQPNHNQSLLYNCCTAPLPFQGTGSITNDPQLLPDRIHVAATSPCRGKGNPGFSGGSDIDGQAWANPPSIGCDEWHPGPAINGRAILGGGGRMGEVSLNLTVVGQDPITCFWTKDGSVITDGAHYSSSSSASLIVREFGAADAGVYQVVASNSFGMVTNQVAQVVVHLVDAGGISPIVPYTTWATAANNIQDAIAASLPGEVVLVTNGIYSSGGTSSGPTNRVFVFSQQIVMSVNGPDDTIIEGYWDPVVTNSSSSVRCAYVSGGTLSGFTLRNGATATAGYFTGNGGGVYNNGGLVTFCILSNNAAAGEGGGGFGGTFLNCVFAANSAVSSGGGVSSAGLTNCLLTGNSAGSQAGGCYSSTLNNCTITRNSASSPGSGAFSCALTNCIVYFNSDVSSGSGSANYASTVMQNCCSLPLASGTGNFSSDPQLADAFHLLLLSQCRGAGTNAPASGVDLDGDAWGSPPSVGCDEIVESVLAGPLAVSLAAAWPEVAAGGSLPLLAQVLGRASRLEWAFGDGTGATNASFITAHSWTNPGDYIVTFTAFNNDHPSGISTNVSVHVVPLEAPPLSNGFYSNNSFSLQFFGQAGVNYAVQQTTNLVPPINWQTIRTLTATGGVVRITDLNATNAARFYRTVAQ